MINVVYLIAIFSDLKLHGDDIYFTLENSSPQRDGVLATNTASLKVIYILILFFLSFDEYVFTVAGFDYNILLVLCFIFLIFCDMVN